MKIQYVSKYLELAEEGLVEKIGCPIDQGLLHANIDDKDSIYLYCLSCNYKKIIGLSFYLKIVKKVQDVIRK